MNKLSVKTKTNKVTAKEALAAKQKAATPIAQKGYVSKYSEEELDAFADRDISMDILAKSITKTGNFILRRRHLEKLLASLHADEDSITIFQNSMYNQFTGEKKPVLKYYICGRSFKS